MGNRLLRLSRIAISLVASGVITVAAAGIALQLPHVAAWLAGVQVFGAVASFSMSVFVSWLLVTLVLGRVYCSTVCPLGTMMDVCARLPRLTAAQRRRRHYGWRQPVRLLQWGVLVLVVALLMAGVSAVAEVFDPYTVYTGIVSRCAVPPIDALAGGRLMAKAAAFTAAGCGVSAILAVLVAAVSALGGRTACNTVCPVGTTLGFVSRFSIMRIDIDTDKCTRCGACEDVCKASCIDLRYGTVDGSRCVACFDCLPVCPNDAIHYTGRRHQLSDVLMQRVGPPEQAPGEAAPTAMGAPGNQCKNQSSCDNISNCSTKS